MRKFSILFILLFSISVFAKGNRQDDPSYQVDHNRTKNFTPTVHFTQDQIDRVSDIFSGMTGNTFTINSDLGDVTSKLIFGRTTGGNAEISYNGTNIGLNKYTTVTVADSQVGMRLIGDTGRLRIYPYDNSTYGTLLQAMQTDEGSFPFYIPMTFGANPFIFYYGQVLINATSAIGTEKLRVNGNQYNDGTASLDALILREKSSDPADPAEGQSVIWQSDGTGAGDDGDLMVKITAGGVTKTTTLVDFSGI